jgi:hypothetical protein
MANQPGGQLENVNAVKHGMRSKRFGIVHAKLGRRFAAAYFDTAKLRLKVEELAGLSHEGMDPKEKLLKLAKVQSLIRAEEGCRACEAMIRSNPEMSAEEIRQQRYAIQQFTRERDKLLGDLLGDGKAGSVGDVFGDLYR